MINGNVGKDNDRRSMAHLPLLVLQYAMVNVVSKGASISVWPVSKESGQIVCPDKDDVVSSLE